jgi:hypothetical protein
MLNMGSPGHSLMFIHVLNEREREDVLDFKQPIVDDNTVSHSRPGVRTHQASQAAACCAKHAIAPCCSAIDLSTSMEYMEMSKWLNFLEHTTNY